MPGRRRRVAVFFDGRNARGGAAKAFDSDELANFSPRLLARQVCEAQGWQLASVSYYIGLPGEGRLVRGESREDLEKRLGHWRRQGVRVVTRPLSGRNKEKGIDVRLALDMTQQFRRGQYDVALIFSQDQDFQEVVDELRELGRLEGRRVLTACAFPGREDPKFNRGIDNVDYTLPLSRDVYERSLETAAAHPVRRRIFGLPVPDYRPIPFAFATYLGVAMAVFLYTSIDQGLRAPSAEKGVFSAVMNMGSNGAAAIVWPGFVFEWLLSGSRAEPAVSPAAAEERAQPGSQKMAEQAVTDNDG
ncbi:MAG: NYN domain-containing protein [Alphaproteobacteria bacterium]